jgi:hypothetical protein
MPIARRLARLAPGLLLVTSAAAGCNDSNGSSDHVFVVSGPITNVSGQPIPSNARVVVAWVVSSGSPDYTYIHGEGTVEGSSFSVSLSPPPAAALNQGQVGVGIPVLTTNAGLRTGVRLEDVSVSPEELLGATGQFAVIYKATDAVTYVDWADAFPLGFGAGHGVERPGDFDAFEPVAPTSLELIVDDFENIDFVNWT